MVNRAITFLLSQLNNIRRYKICPKHNKHRYLKTDFIWVHIDIHLDGRGPPLVSLP